MTMRYAKRWLTAAALTSVSVPAMAIDATPLFAFYAGAGNWMSEYEGDIGAASATADFGELGFDDGNNQYFYAAFEHPIPIIPNVRLELSDLSSSATGELSNSYTLDDQTYAAGTSIASDFDMTFTDLTLYYEILLVDFGLTARQFDVELSAVPTSNPDNSASASVDGVLPLLYLQAKVPLPFTGVYLTGAGNFISFDNKSVSDFRGAVGYDIELGPTTLGLELGYRMFELDLGDEEDLAGVVELSGAFVSLNLEF